MREAGGVLADIGDLDAAVGKRLDALGEVVPRIWARDHTVWSSSPREISDRLGWLEAPERARRALPELMGFAEEVVARGLTHALLLGMGGSSLAPEVFRHSFGAAPGMLDLRVLDSTHPNAVASVERELPLDRTLFLVSSKSGTTVETLSQMEHFLTLTGDPSRFAAITDPGTSLEETGRERGFLRVFAAPPDVGGRYSALTEFGLVPAALLGVDLDALLSDAARAAEACGPDVPIEDNPGALVGAVLGEGALAGRDKLTDGGADPVGPWVEQLVAESTGKEDTGILPVDQEPSGAAGTYGHDRLFWGFGERPGLEPRFTMPREGRSSLGGAMFLLEFGTAVAGHVLGIHPFDQPDVQSAKDRTAELLASGRVPDEPDGDPDDLMASVKPGDYVAIQAFVNPSAERWKRMQEARGRIRSRLRVATTLGYGPRYLHSTGQYHKGGPNTGVFLQLFEEPGEDLAIPGQDFTFGSLIAAQAAGDLAALRERGRRVARISEEALSRWDG